jgi:hypothetical protein
MIVKRKDRAGALKTGNRSLPKGLPPGWAGGKNNSAGWRRIRVRLQGASAGACSAICAGGCNAVNGLEDKQVGGIIFPVSLI